MADARGELFTLQDYLGPGNTFLLFFEFHNCESCIAKGLADVESLQKAGMKVAVVAIEDELEYVLGRAKFYPGLDFFLVKKADFYEKAEFSHLPVLARFESGKMRFARQITI